MINVKTVYFFGLPDAMCYRRKCQGSILAKVHRKDQSVERNAYFYYFGQFCVFPLYF